MEKFNTCKYGELVSSEVTGAEEPIYACLHPKMIEQSSLVVVSPQPEKLQPEKHAVLRGLGVRENDLAGNDLSVDEALNEICGPCQLHEYCDTKRINQLTAS